MLEIELDLVDGRVKFIPEVGPGPGELRTIFRDWCMNFDDVRSRRFEALRCLHFTDTTRVHQTSFLRPFGPRRGRRGDGVVAMPRRRDAVGALVREPTRLARAS